MQPDGPLKAKVVFVHGFSDHVGRYYDFFPTLARAGIAALARLRNGSVMSA